MASSATFAVNDRSNKTVVAAKDSTQQALQKHHLFLDGTTARTYGSVTIFISLAGALCAFIHGASTIFTTPLLGTDGVTLLLLLCSIVVVHVCHCFFTT